MTMRTLCLLAGVWIMLSGCAGNNLKGGDGAGRPAREDGVGISDYRQLVDSIVESMVQGALTGKEDKRPVIALGPITNNTRYNIETRMLVEDIRVAVMQSGAALFSTAVDYEKKGSESGQLYKQLEYQNLGFVDPATAKEFGKIVGADYVLYGSIYELKSNNRGSRDADFKFNLTLQDIATGLAVWADTKHVTKAMLR